MGLFPEIPTPSSFADDNILDIMWNLEIHTINQNLMNIPMATVNISFENYEAEITSTQPYEGFHTTGHSSVRGGLPFRVGQKLTRPKSDADYDGVHNSTEISK